MQLFNVLSATLALSSSALAFPTFGSDVGKELKSSIFEKLAAPPAGWTRDDTVQFDKDSSTIKLRIHLAQQGIRDFHDLVMKVFEDPYIYPLIFPAYSPSPILNCSRDIWGLMSFGA
jgi:tripeptidyl-peptidase-1